MTVYDQSDSFDKQFQSVIFHKVCIYLHPVITLYFMTIIMIIHTTAHYFYSFSLTTQFTMVY